MRTMIILSLILVGCGKAPALDADITGNLAGSPGLSPVTAGPADLTGTWRWQGGYCGAAWTPSNHTEDIAFAGGVMTVTLVTACGMTVVQHYAVTQTDTALSMKLTKSWQPGPGCPGVLNSVPNGGTDVATYGVTGNQLTMTEGTCAGGQASRTLYEKL